MSAPERQESAPDAVPANPTARGLPASVIVQLTLINLLWGASSVAAKYGLAAFGPFTLTLLRSLPAGLLLFGLARAGGERTPLRREDGPAFFVLAFVGLVLTYGIFYTGMAQATATDASLLFACEPLLIALFARLFLRERLSTQQWSGLLLGLIGVWLITGRELGNLLMLGALCFETATGILGKGLTRRYPGLLIVGTQMLVGSALLLPLAGWEIARHPPALTWQAVAGVCYLALVCSAFCYGVWYFLLHRFPVSTMGVFILVQPVMGPLYGWLLRGEAMSLRTGAGAALVILGITLTSVQPSTSR